MKKRINWSSTDVIGMKFGKLCVTRVLPIKSGTNRFVECVCDCGKIARVLNCSLTSGASRSCGCMHDCHRRHGDTGSPTYRAWQNASRPVGRKPAYWQTYEQFVKDMGPKPPGHFLCRLNKKLGFSPNNCKWTPHA